MIDVFMELGDLDKDSHTEKTYVDIKMAIYKPRRERWNNPKKKPTFPTR